MQPRRRDDAGITLVETVVGMLILSVVIGVFASALRVMTTATSRTYAVTDSTSAARRATDLLGRQLAYASAANPPVTLGTSDYFEFQTDAVKVGGDAQCTQWRYQQATGALDYRTWSVVTLTSSGWIPVAKAMVNDAVTQQPFTLYPKDEGFTIMRVLADLRIQAPNGPVVQVQGQYTLRNVPNDPSAPAASTVCTQLGRP